MLASAVLAGKHSFMLLASAKYAFLEKILPTSLEGFFSHLLI